MTSSGLYGSGRPTLPRFARMEIAAANDAARPRAPLPLPGAGDVMLDEGGAGPCGPAQYVVSLVWGVHHLDVRCPAALLDALVRRWEPTLDVAAGPSDIACLLLDAAVAPLAGNVEQDTSRDVAVVGVHRDNSAPQSGFRLRLTLPEGDFPLHVGGSGEAELLRLWPRAGRAMTRLPLPAALRLGTTRLPAAILASIRPGDALLLEVCRQGAATLVVCEHWIAPAIRVDQGWRLERAPSGNPHDHEEDWTMHGETQATRPAASDPDTLPIKLAFDLGSVDITLGALRDLGAGALIDLRAPLDACVRISAHGTPIGTGELVDIDGTVGVRIVRLFDHG